MANAATAKRGAGLKCNSEGADTEHSASDSASPLSSASSGDAAKTSSPHESATVRIELAPSDAPLSEKRRIAALISWQKRRKNSESKSLAQKSMQACKRKRSEVSAPVTPPQKARRAMQKTMNPPAAAKAPPPAKKHRADAGSSSGEVSPLTDAEKFSAIRREAAKLGWERRRIQLAAAVATAASRSSRKLDASSTNTKRSITDIRREAAKLGWERRKQLTAESMPGSSMSDDAASSTDDQSSASAQVRENSSRVTAPTASRRKVYSVSSRRKAAILGWEKRRIEKAERTSVSSSPIPYDTSFFAQMLSKLQSLNRNENYRNGTKRSRRLADDSSDSYEDEMKMIAQLVSYLRVSRGWMEFQPSSRLGSGTAIYGYIPSSIAAFIRSGAISQRTVLDHGTLGVHYALDWDGYGGLKDMLATFGEDYSPFPTEEMLESSRITEWELGEDLPWKEWVESEEEKLVQRAADKTESIALATKKVDDMEEMMNVARILANLDRETAEDCDQTGNESQSIAEEENLFTTHSASSSRSQANIVSTISDGGDMNGYEDHWEGPVTENKDNLMTQLPNYFRHWNFGL